MSRMVLIDTSCWIEYFNRPGEKIADRVRALVRDDRAALTGIILSELLQGARTIEEASELRLALEAPVFLESDRKVYVRAGELGFELRQQGITVPLTDCIIAAVAEADGASVLTLDGHFEHLARVASLQIERD